MNLRILHEGTHLGCLQSLNIDPFQSKLAADLGRKILKSLRQCEIPVHQSLEKGLKVSKDMRHEANCL